MVELSSCLWIPERDFTPALENKLTLDVFQLSGESLVVECFRTDREGYIGLPRVFGLQSISVPYETRTSSGYAVTFPQHIKLKDYQKPFVEEMLEYAEVHGDFVAKAATGSGKTIMGLAVLQRRGRSAAIVVDQENLMEQWVARIHQFLGLTPDQIGIVQGPTATWEDKPITICMVQTLTQREYPQEFYDNFGTVVFDECHSVGAPTFSRALLAFSAAVRIGLSATPDRRDELRKMLAWNLGETGPELASKPARSSVYVLEGEGVYSWASNNSKLMSRFVSEIAADGRRNLLLAEAIKWLYDSGRDVLVVGDRIEQLSALRALCVALGLPADELGEYAKRRSFWKYEKDPRPPRRPPGWVRGTEYTPVRLALVVKDIPKPERQHALDHARVIFATYAVMAKGVDVVRLSAGVDATPRSAATQVYGRLLRPMDGKLRPIWVTTADVNSFRSLFQLTNRLPDYVTQNAEVFLWDPQRGKKKLEVRAYRRELKSRISLLRRSEIVTRLDGSYMLKTPSTLTDSAV